MQTKKITKNAVSYVIYNKDRSKVLGVLRPPDDKELPNVWGLPATLLRDGESFEEAVLRAGKQKIGVELKIKKVIGEDDIEREDYVLHMRDYEVEIAQGEPKAPQPYQDGTQYQACRWVDPSELREAAGKGSLCTQIYLSHIKLDW